MMFVCLLVLSVWGVGEASFGTLGNVLPEIPDPSILIFQEKCRIAMGIGPSFLSALSLTPVGLKTKFTLYTPTNPNQGERIEVTEESIRGSSFDAELPVKLLIHGFMSSLDADDIRFQMKDALLKENDYNIIIVDWTKHNGPIYFTAVASARAIAAQLADLLKLIMRTTGVRAQDIHIIGHSLGAQMAGWTGQRIPNLGRITGLDPAGPCFRDAKNSHRLDATDALFVDVIHTDRGDHLVDGFGIGDPVGHMDFYPNGGGRQPGCAYTSPDDNAIGAVVNLTTKWFSHSCDHGRANDYFLESIDNSECRFMATWCNTYDDFQRGDCLPENSILSEMGFHAKPIPQIPRKSKFFLRTNDASPFCNERSIYLEP